MRRTEVNIAKRLVKHLTGGHCIFSNVHIISLMHLVDLSLVGSYCSFQQIRSIGEVRVGQTPLPELNKHWFNIFEMLSRYNSGKKSFSSFYIEATHQYLLMRYGGIFKRSYLQKVIINLLNCHSCLMNCSDLLGFLRSQVFSYEL